MRNKITIFLVILIAVMPQVISAQRNLTKEQQQFVDSLLPVINQVNREIAKQRTGVYTIYQEFRLNQMLCAESKQVIFDYARLYRLDVADDTAGFAPNDSIFKMLLRRVDIVPRKLVLAQAALESNWGNSRFVEECNNYFGIQCYTPGCGVHAKRAKNKNVRVKSYPTIIDGIRDYMLLLNSSKYYSNFRDLRIVNRLNTDLPDPFYVVKGLENYSVRGEAYIDSLIQIMKINFHNL